MIKSTSTSLVYLIITVFIVLISTTVFSKNAEPNNLEELKDEITKIQSRYNIPAIGIAMIENNQPIWVGSLGKVNLVNNIDADENSLYRIASTSKMFVGLSILKLIEQGQLSLNDKLSDLAPEIEFSNPWEDSNPILLVNLLEHTTGWDEQHYPEFAHNDPKPITLKQGLDFHPHSRTSRWIPGTRFSYSNSGPAVAAYIVEKVSGVRFEDFVQTHFFDPIGMKSATYFLTDTYKNKGVTLYNNENKPLLYSHMIMRPAGSINASPNDMASFLKFYLNRGKVNGKTVISKKSLNRMEKVESTDGAKAGLIAGYGLNNYSSFHKQWVYREHNGGFEGAMAEFAYLPEARLGHAIMINKKHPRALEKISDLIRNFETRNLDKPLSRNIHTITDEHRKIEGLYNPINPRLQKLAFLFQFRSTKKLYFEGNMLIQEGILGGQKRYYLPISPTLYQSKDNNMASLVLVNDPLAGWVVHDSSKNAGSGNNVVLKPVTTWLGYSQLIIELSWLFVIVSSVFYFLIWIIRKLSGKIPSGATMRVRLWPLLSSLALISTVLLIIVASADYYKYLSTPTYVSIGLMLTTIAYAIFSFISLYTVLKERKSPMNSANYWYNTYASITHVLMTIYMFTYGVIGIMFWT